MTIFDRYLLRTFARVLIVSFLSLTGLFIIIDLFGNLEEFISYAERRGSLLAVLSDYYGARVLSFFDRISGLLALIAAIFTITWFQRTNELTAVMAGGISKARVVRPLIMATAVVALAAAGNRELTLPRVRDKLSRNAQDWLGETAKRMNPRRDNQTYILLGGKASVAAHQLITQPSFRLPHALSQFGRQLAAQQATYHPPTQDRPGGYLLEGVTQPDNVSTIDTGYVGDEPVILTAKQHAWLKDRQCFVASDVTFEHLAADMAWQRYSSTAELIAALRNPSLDYGQDAGHRPPSYCAADAGRHASVSWDCHWFWARSDRSIFVAGALCLLLVAGFFLVVLACQALGTTVTISPALAAWLPLIIFAPAAYVSAAHRWE